MTTHACRGSSAAKGLQVNACATKFYHERCGGAVPWEIYGDAVIVPDADFAPPHMRDLCL
ncbi:hypothetical protein D0B32_30880 [Paraburkholderia sp. DHOC27]|nr:hypothetical protein D0B32_30880 [Paraburkholderia sp. DHOC27]